MQKIEVVRSLVVEIHDERLAPCTQEWETAQAAATAATARRCPSGQQNVALSGFDQVSNLDT